MTQSGRRSSSPGSRSTRSGGSFPSTHWSIVARGRDAVPGSTAYRQAVENIARLYWKPVYAYLRLRWQRTRDEAMDATQDLFLQMLEGRWLPVATPERGRFRAFLRACLDNEVKMGIREDRALKRGGGQVLSIDWGEDPDRFLVLREGDTPEEILDRHWRKAVLQECLRRLEEEYRKEGRPEYYEAYRRYTLTEEGDPTPTYDELASALGIPRSSVGNYLVHARRRLRGLVREALQATVESADDLRREEKDFYGSRPC